MSWDLLRSIRDMNPEAARATGLDASAKLVLLILAVHADKQGDAYPSRSTLANECLLSEATLKRVTRRLRVAGLVKMLPSKRYRPPKYRLLLGAIAKLRKPPPRDPSGATRGDQPDPLSGGITVIPSGVQGGSNRPPRGDQGEPSGGINLIPSSIPPMEEPKEEPKIPAAGAAPVVPQLELVSENERKPSDHARVIGAFADAYERAKGVPWKSANGAKDGAAVKRALATFSAVELVTAIARAFEDPFVRDHKPDIAFILANVNAYRGTSRPSGPAKKQPSTGSTWLQKSEEREALLRAEEQS